MHRGKRISTTCFQLHVLIHNIIFYLNDKCALKDNALKDNEPNQSTYRTNWLHNAADARQIQNSWKDKFKPIILHTFALFCISKEFLQCHAMYKIKQSSVYNIFKMNTNRTMYYNNIYDTSKFLIHTKQLIK